jgi:hypothetical protein
VWTSVGEGREELCIDQSLRAAQGSGRRIEGRGEAMGRDARMASEVAAMRVVRLGLQRPADRRQPLGDDPRRRAKRADARRARPENQPVYLRGRLSAASSTECALAHQNDLRGLVVSNMMASGPAYNDYAHTVLIVGGGQRARRGPDRRGLSSSIRQSRRYGKRRCRDRSSFLYRGLPPTAKPDFSSTCALT